MSDARPATDRVLRGDVIAKLRSSQETCMCHEKNVVQMTTYLDMAPPTPEEIDRLARCMWVRDGLPRAWFDNEPGTPESISVGGVVADMRASYRRDAEKMLVILQQGGNFDAD